MRTNDESLGTFGYRLPELRGPPPGPASCALSARLRKVESRNVTHVTSRWPIFWEEARGANVRDADGNVYLDLTSAFGVALLGHAHPGVVAAVRAQAEKLVHGMGDVHPPVGKVELLERLSAMAPWPDGRTVLASTGSEAVEIALKTAFLATGRPGILAFEGAYHGLTLGALSVTSGELFRGPFKRRAYGGVAFAPFPDAGRGPGPAARSLEIVRRLMASGTPDGSAIGTVIVEPVQGRAGARVPPPGFMAALSEVAREMGVLVIADEVLTGMGRCGAALASELVGLVADIVCLGKSLGGGLPLSACVARPDVMAAWPESEGEAVHTSTFLGHPLACAAGVAVFDAIAREDLVERVRALGAGLRSDVRGALEGISGVGEVRGLGLLVGIDLRAPDGAPAAGAAARAAEAALSEGVLVLPAGEHGNVVELTPPATLTPEQVGYAVGVLERAIRRTVG